MTGAYLLSHIPLFAEEFARGGGGGSGGDGGGSGGIFFLVGFIGYFPAAVVGRIARKRFLDDPSWKVVQGVLWATTAALSLFIVIGFGFLGSALGEIYFAFPVAIGLLVGIGSGMYGWFAKVKQSKQTHDALLAAKQNDPAWDEAKLIEYASAVFYQYQADWSNGDTESMKWYLSQNYYNHSLLMMYALQGAFRANRVNAPQIQTAMITDVRDATDNTQDMFTVGFTAKANDQLYDTRTEKLLFQDNHAFTEFWHFTRSSEGWLLAGITQGTENASKVRPDIAQFAAQNGLYYSPDWGWLLLPADGYIFKKGKFGISDINNHMIGFVNNVLTQGYTYEPVSYNNGYKKDQHLVMQTNVPKSYGRILVRRKSKLFSPSVGGLTRIKMEWGEFNDMYEVFASDLERVTSFELLNPAFMAILRDLPYEVNIEVVDNVLYLFTKSGTDISHYASLFDVLLRAHKEMKL